ncbi:MAG: ATP-binding cassette domain-containing protein [Bacteroidetes Order II. Incertae sedis bacterium]|nr:ATP-binding cassette domain-containing protein [Bacteroidetes Order II. bacterium]
MTYSIQINSLTHHFENQQKVLNNINIAVPQGSIYGFLGPNGAGKTTSLRLMLGLLQKQKGKIEILGKTFEKNRIEILKQTGSLIEYPSIYGQLTAYQNVLVWQKIYQCSKSRIDEVLHIVGLSETGNKKASNFSLGMKQRLGLAIALLNNPSLLILDEPTNGLDPNGIIEIRELLINLNKEQGITIVISSHLLSEIEKLVTHIGLIHKGNVLFEGTLNELLETQKKASFVIANTSNNTKAIELLQSMCKPILQNAKIQMNVRTDEEISKIVQALVMQNIDVYEIYRSNADLESIFMNYIN